MKLVLSFITYLWYQSAAQVVEPKINLQIDGTTYKFSVINLQSKSDSTTFKWSLDRVVPLPNGVKLPDFYYSFIDQIDSINYCNITQRNRQLLSIKDLPPQFYPVIDTILANEKIKDAIDNGFEPEGLSPDEKISYTALKLYVESQQATIKQTISDYVAWRQEQDSLSQPSISIDQSADSSSDTVPIIIEDPLIDPESDIARPPTSSEIKKIKDYVKEQSGIDFGGINISDGQVKSVTDELSKRLNYLQSHQNDNDISILISNVVTTISNSSAPLITVPKSSFRLGYVYYLSVKVENSIQVNYALSFDIDLRYQGMEELKDIEKYLKIPDRCFNFDQQIAIQVDLSAHPQLIDKNISIIMVEMAPFFQFANDDYCVETVGWRVKRKFTELKHIIQMRVPLTIQDPLAAYISFTVNMTDGSQLVGLTCVTIKGLVIEVGQLLEKLDTQDSLVVLAGIASAQQGLKNNGSTVDLKQLDMSDLIQLSQQLSQISSAQQVVNSSPDLVMVQRVLQQCTSSLSWMVQKLKSQYNIANVSNETLTNVCGNVQCGAKGECKLNEQQSQSYCSCALGYAGPSCQYMEAEYNSLLNAQKQILTQVMSNQDMDEMDFDQLQTQVSLLSSQPISDQESVDQLKILIKSSVEKLESAEQLNIIIENLHNLKESQQRVIQAPNQSEKFKQIGSILMDAIRQGSKLTSEKLEFKSADSSGQLQPVGEWKAQDEVTLQLEQSISSGISVQYPIPSAQMIGVNSLNITKTILFMIYDCKYIGLDDCGGPIVTLALLDNDGNEIPQGEEDGKSFQLDIPYTYENATQCGWYNEITAEIQTEGCQSFPHSNGKIRCLCNHLTKFMATTSYQPGQSNTHPSKKLTDDGQASLVSALHLISISLYCFILIIP